MDARSNPDWISVELSSRRTGMSFQRTRLSAERTLMSVIRTSLSLIGFGFTIYQLFQKMYESKVLPSLTPARNFGMALLLLGCLILIVGIIYHLMFMRGLRQERAALHRDGLVHAESHYPISFTLLTALALLLIGVLAVLSTAFRIGPFG